MTRNNLLGVHPKDVLLFHGDTKRLLDAYHWHSPKFGIVASYTPKPRDVKDHFGVFRGVDQIESCVQAIVASTSRFLESQKHEAEPKALAEKFIPVFISIGQVYFHSYLEEGETFINIGHTKFYKFRQMVSDGRIYRVPKGLDLDEYFANFSEKQIKNYDLSPDFKLISEFFDLTGRALKKDF